MRALFSTYTVTICILVIPTFVSAQQRGPVPTRYVELLKSPAVRAELELQDEQAKEIDKITADRSELTTLAMSQIDRLDSLDKKREVYATLQQSLANADRAAMDALLPFQQDRLIQIDRQSMIQATDILGGLAHPTMMEALNINDTQLKVIRLKAEEADVKLQARLAALRKQEQEAKEEARQHVFSALFDDQKKKYSDLIGNVVEIVHTNPLAATVRAAKAKGGDQKGEKK